METDFEFVAAKQWHKTNGQETPVNLRERLDQSSIFADLNITEEDRERVCDIITKNIERALLVLEGNKEVEEFLEEFKEKMEEFKKGSISLLVLSKFTDTFAEQFGIDSTISAISTEIKNNVYFHLKGYIKGELANEARTFKDDTLDNNKKSTLDEGLKEGLAQIREILEVASKFSGCKTTYTPYNPGQKDEHIVQIKDGKTTEEPINYDGLEFEKYNLATGILKKEKKNDKNIELFYATQIAENENLTTVVFKMVVDGKELGFIEYCFEGKGIHPLILRMCSNITAVLDTFIDRKLSEKLQQDIEREKLRISKDYKLNQWRDILIENCKVLSNILGKPVGFSCNKYDSSKSDKWTVVVNGDSVTLKDEHGGLGETKFGGSTDLFNLEINEDGENLHIGTLAVDCDNPFEEGIANSFKNSTEEILRQREQKRHTLTHAVGLNVANAYLDGNLEPLKKHPVAVLYADIVGFSRFTKDLRDLAKRNDIEESVVAKIIIEFITRVATQIESKFNVVVDKFVGDELIILCGLPLADGKDAFGNEKTNINQLLEVAQNASEAIQTELSEISHQVIKEIFKENHIFEKIDVDLMFSFGLGIARDLAGMLGDPENKKSRLDYSIIGHDMNLIARILGAAGPNQVLVWKKSWDEYDGDDLVAIEEPFLIEGKNIGLVEVVAVEHRKTFEARQNEQRTLCEKLPEMARKFREANQDGKFVPFRPENINDLPDGVYRVEKDRKPSEGLYKATLSFEEHGFSANIPSTHLEDVTLYVTTERYEELKKEENDIQLHKKGAKFMIVYYKCIEDKINESIEKQYKANSRLGRKESEFHLKHLLPGDWKIIGYQDLDEKHHFELRRRRKVIDLYLDKDEKSLKGDPLAHGTLVFDDGVCKCENRKPNWEELYD